MSEKHISREQELEQERLRAYTRNNENAPDPTHEMLERTDSPEKEPRTYRVAGSPARVHEPSYLWHERDRSHFDPRRAEEEQKHEREQTRQEWSHSRNER